MFAATATSRRRRESIVCLAGWKLQWYLQRTLKLQQLLLECSPWQETHNGAQCLWYVSLIVGRESRLPIAVALA